MKSESISDLSTELYKQSLSDKLAELTRLEKQARNNLLQTGTAYTYGTSLGISGNTIDAHKIRPGMTQWYDQALLAPQQMITSGPIVKKPFDMEIYKQCKDILNILHPEKEGDGAS